MSFLGRLIRSTRKSREATSGLRTEISAAAGSVRSARATERNLRTVTQEVSSEIDSTVAKLDKLGGKATISGQLMKAGFVGGGAALVSGFTSSLKEKFGDQLSGGMNFTIGAVGTIGTGALGLRAMTHVGRAGILAHGRYAGGSSSIYAYRRKLVGARRSASSASRDMQGPVNNMHSAVNAARPRQLQARMGMGTGSLRTRIAQEGIVPGNARQTLDAFRNLGRTKEAIRSSQVTQRAMNQARRVDKTTRQASSISNRAKNTSAGIKEAMGDSQTVFKNLKANKQKFNQLNAYNRAENFSAGKLAFGLAKMPFTMGGAMLGKGSGMLGGTVDPAMKFIGPAMGIGTISGLAAGTAVGISALRTGNLGRTQGAMQKQQGRSFSNISYNATLHSHRLNN